MKKLIDHYYLVLMRGYENLHGEGRFFYFHITYIISMTISVNAFTVMIFLMRRFFDMHYIWFMGALFVVGLTIRFVFDAIYNEKRRAELREKYKEEDVNSRQWGAAWVWIYELFSVAFLVFAFWVTA